MSFRLVSGGWDRELDAALLEDGGSVRVICPFMKERAARRLLEHGCPQRLQVITRFDLQGFAERVSDTRALRELLQAGAEIRGVKRLHAKVYLIGGDRAIVTSANLTEAALRSNHEFGFVSDDAAVVGQCHSYFDSLWAEAGDNLSRSTIDRWERLIDDALAAATPPDPRTALPDEGVEIEPSDDDGLTGVTVDAPQWLIKFFGRARERAPLSRPVIDEVSRTGCHWACTYPRGLRPRRVRDGAVMYLARLVEGPDIHVFGRAIGAAHRPGHDDATAEERRRRPWKEQFPHYVRVRDPELVAGTLANGVSMRRMMDALEERSFATTSHNAARGSGNVNPRLAYRSRPDVELGADGQQWLEARLQQAFDRHGRLSPQELSTLDWPAVEELDSVGG